MKNTIKCVCAAVVLLALGLIAGWRVTILTARVEIVAPRRVEISAWGQTDLFVCADNT